MNYAKTIILLLKWGWNIKSLYLLFLLYSFTYAQLPTWRFSIIVGISDSTVLKYGGFQTAKNLVIQQFQTVNQKFNSPNVFLGSFQFSVDSVYQFKGNPVNELFIPHPQFDYRVTYDAFPTQGGGWYGPPYNSIHHSWAWNSFGGTFDNYATDGLTHEFGHSRGAVDLYGIKVDADKNPISGQSYLEAVSIMNYPYGESTWDTHSKYLINRNEDAVTTDINYITSAFPSTIGISVFDSFGAPLPNIEIKVYPVKWFQNSVIPTVAYSGQTNSQGEYIFMQNPFNPNTSGFPWDIQYVNFLVSAKINNTISYKFMPLTAVQNFYFSNPSKPYTLVFGNAPLNGIEQTTSLLSAYSLGQNYPNPFNPVTTIPYYLPVNSDVTLTMCDMLGRDVATLVDEHNSAGSHKAVFDGSRFPSGVYMYRMQAGTYSTTKKLVLLK